MIVEGNPAEVRAVNSIALARGGYEAEHIDAVKDAYKRLYRDNGAPMSDKVTELRARYHDVPAILRLCDFLDRLCDQGRPVEDRGHAPHARVVLAPLCRIGQDPIRLGD